MPTPGQQLQHVLTIDDLVRYLEDELGWPLQGYELDELTFEYTPAELGLKEADAAKIKSIYQLRPILANQPWGIFFVEFERKKLPIVVLRRILSHLVVRKRASANQAHRAAWNANDLLFISAYGDADTATREIAFAHFHQEAGDLPTLRVLGWDGNDTALKLAHVAETLRARLGWPAAPADAAAWRTAWAGAFRHRPGHVIATADTLADALAVLARRIRLAALTLLAHETEQGALRCLHKAFQSTLIHDLSEADFADTYAQTITYGLLTAAISRTEMSEGRFGTALTAGDITAMVPITNPFLREMLQTFLKAGGQKGGINFDELGVQDVVELLRGEETDLPAILMDFGNKTQGEDPVIHFYEHFLAAYDKQLKIERGVFYTPKPVVSYIVRSVDELLRSEFGLADGLASTVTWGEMTQRTEGLTAPEGTSADSPFVTILDPATGTATFLVEAIELIHRTMTDKWRREGLGEAQRLAKWNEYVPAHLLPRLYGYELLMAPYAIAHMKIGLKLHETGYRFGSDERVHVYLTNALEPADDEQQRLDGILPALAHEAQAVNAVKRTARFTVVTGNPPYAGVSSNMSDSIVGMVEPYKFIDGISLGERKIWTQDDYKKFIRFAQLAILKTGIGLTGLVTNHGFLSEPTSRGMRHNLLSSFSRIAVLDLHGSLKKREVCPDGSPDKNVFDIEPGVAISFFRRVVGNSNQQNVLHSDLWGLRVEKYKVLLGESIHTLDWSEISPSGDFYLYVPQDATTKEEFANFLSITNVFEIGSNGIQTSRDDVVYGFELSETQRKIAEFHLPETTFPTAKLREKYWSGKKVANYLPGDTRGWHVPHAREQLRKDRIWESRFRKTLYRPFDQRALFYASYMIDWPRFEVMSQMLHPNLALCVGRAGSAADNQEWNIVFVSDSLVDMNLFYRGGNVAFPLRIEAISGSLEFEKGPRPNFQTSFLRELFDSLDIAQASNNVFEHPLPEDILCYIYALLHSPTYRTRYAEFLKIDFPRIPLPGSRTLFDNLARLGGELVVLHLVEFALADEADAPAGWPRYARLAHFRGGDRTVATFPAADKAWRAGRVAINASSGFDGVPEAVWNFHVGGYQVCHKWLKDRKGAHYQRRTCSITARSSPHCTRRSASCARSMR